MLKIVLLCAAVALTSATYGTIPASGQGTATVYSTSSYESGVGACNCRKGIAKYPTAALNQFYFGTGPGGGSGKACGQCFKLTITGDPYSPGWKPSSTISLVVKVADLCPAIAPNLDWCAATATTPNKFGVIAHFDLDQTHAGVFAATGKGAFRVNYCQVSCTQWAGYNDPNANDRQSTNWGACPKDVAAAGTCSAPGPAPAPAPKPAPAPAPKPAPAPVTSRPTSAPAPAPAPSSAGRPSFSWNANSNQWWFAMRISPRPSSVSVNCGSGFVPVTNPSWDVNSWEHNGQCTGTFQIKINGVAYNAALFDTTSRYSELDVADDTENDVQAPAEEEETAPQTEEEEPAQQDTDVEENDDSQEVDDELHSIFGDDE